MYEYAVPSRLWAICCHLNAEPREISVLTRRNTQTAYTRYSFEGRQFKALTEADCESRGIDPESADECEQGYYIWELES